MTRPDWIEVGRVSRPHGVHGEVRIIPDSDNPDRFVKGMVVHARSARPGMVEAASGSRTRLTIESVRGDAGFPIVLFAEVSDRETATGLRGFVLEVPGAELPELAQDEYYPFEIEGLTVRDPEGNIVGHVADVVDTPAHPLLVVALDSGREALVPFVLAAVPDVILDEGYLVVQPEFLETQ